MGLRLQDGRPERGRLSPPFTILSHPSPSRTWRGKLWRIREGAMAFAGINYLAILIAAVASWLAGAVWYMALAKPWMAAIGVTAEQIKMSYKESDEVVDSRFVALP